MCGMITQEGLSLIKKYEGFKPVVYLCPAGYKTIGYGHKLKEGETFENELSVEEAEELLLEDLDASEKVVQNLNEKVPLSSWQYDALVSFVFNVGAGNFENSSLYNKLLNHDFVGAASEFPRWCYITVKKDGKQCKIGSQGLLNRRIAEMQFFLYRK